MSCRGPNIDEQGQRTDSAKHYLEIWRIRRSVILHVVNMNILCPFQDLKYIFAMQAKANLCTWSIKQYF